jgi:hypothetical protein
MPSFFSSAFQGFSSLFSAAPLPPAAPDAANTGDAAPDAANAGDAAPGRVAAPGAFSEMAAGVAPHADGVDTGAVTRAPAKPVAPAVNASWFKLALAMIDIALTKPGQDRRRAAVRRALGDLGAGAVILALGLGALVPLPVAAQNAICGERASIIERLRTKYGESLRGAGVFQGRRVVEVWASETSGSWTIVVTLPNGSTCLMASGEDWEGIEASAPVSGRGA